MNTSKYIKIKAPKSINDLRIKHLEFLKDEKYHKNTDTLTFIEFISKFTNTDINELKKVNLIKLKGVYLHLISIFQNYKISEPEKEIEIEGIKYELVQPAKVGIGWHIDVANSDLENDPSRIASLMYIEKGTNYGELDENLNMNYSNKKRAEIFEKEMPLPVYLNLLNFFFEQINKINKQIHGEPKENEETEKKNIKFLWEKLIHQLSKEFNQPWENILKWNVYTFYHRLKFINFTIKEETKQIERVKRF